MEAPSCGSYLEFSCGLPGNGRVLVPLPDREVWSGGGRADQRAGLGPGGGLAAKDIVNAVLHPAVRPARVRSGVAILSLDPHHRVSDRERADEVILTVPVCPVQEARLKRGLQDTPAVRCMRRSSLLWPAVDPAFPRPSAGFAPPGPHPRTCTVSGDSIARRS